MLKDIDACRKKGLDEEKLIECCWQIGKNYWHQVQLQLAQYEFSSDEDEIDFFKNIKPLFASEIEYYNLMLHAQLFQPLYDKELSQKFWNRELLRLERFIENNGEFYDYCKSGKTNFDRFFYLRRFNEDPEYPDPLLTELEKKTSTRNDGPLAEYLALQKYILYVQKQIDKLNTIRNEKQN
jgi:hypothetical protein